MREIPEYQDAIETQLSFIKTSCDLYDDGQIEESLRIATSINTLLITSGKQISIVSQLLKELNKKGLNCKISLLSTGHSSPKLENDIKKRDTIVHTFKDEEIWVQINGNKIKAKIVNSDVKSHSNNFLSLAFWSNDRIIPFLDTSRDNGDFNRRLARSRNLLFPHY